ncbi:MAG: hypothetical protein COT73_07535 [Bdellovibrio sp. CG10_big_fil_rev_8_21_14_0_10_47_8]|nr:MAG: hypothetical protein COT73_07535 [Bdellovibrio sp. CG10_big_fil_rev_8_21_14_0_10_47_8]
MKAVTEFPSYILTKALAAKAALTTEGKTPEEIQQNLGESFKLEGDRLKHFVAALDVAAQNTESLRRVLVIGLNEGEVAPAKAVKVEEHYYLPEFLVLTNARPERNDRKGGGQRGGKGKGGPKGSPWGLSPEEKAAKNNKAPAKA